MEIDEKYAWSKKGMKYKNMYLRALDALYNNPVKTKKSETKEKVEVRNILTRIKK